MTQQHQYADRERLATLWNNEVATFSAAHPKSEVLWRSALPHMPDGVPMLWMAKWPGPWPVYVEKAEGAHFTCVDGINHVDLCLGDTGAMCGHAPAASVRAISEQLSRGSTHMLPTADAAVAAEMLAERFGVQSWQFSLSATDANRSLIRYARQVTNRPKILVIDHCYHGTVDEAYAPSMSTETLWSVAEILGRRSIQPRPRWWFRSMMSTQWLRPCAWGTSQRC